MTPREQFIEDVFMALMTIAMFALFIGCIVQRSAGV